MTSLEIILTICSSVLGAGFISFILREIIKNRLNKKLSDRDAEELHIKELKQKEFEEHIQELAQKEVDDEMTKLNGLLLQINEKLDSITVISEKVQELEKRVNFMYEEREKVFTGLQSIEKLESANLSLLRDRLHQLNRFCTDRGYATEWDRINFQSMYDSYIGLGGNNEMHSIKDQYFQLPINAPKPKRTYTKKAVSKEEK